MGRRWGKTILGGCVSLATAARGGHVAWIVPTYKNGRALWRWCENATSGLKRGGVVTVNRAERLIEFRNGGFLGIYSADNEDSIRSEAFHLVVLDEAAKMTETTWTDAVQPTLADYDGDAILISTPRGQNWFWREWMQAKDSTDMAAFRAPTSDNPKPQIRAAAEKAKTRVPSHTYRQEWLAEFLSDGVYFQNVDKAAVLMERSEPGAHKGHSIYGGLDWAMADVWTVLTLACQECNRVVDWDRFNQIDYTYQRERIVAMCQRWDVSGILPERNSIGQPNIELLLDRVPVLTGPDKHFGFNTSATTKPQLIQRLASALEHDGFQVPTDYADELRSYQVEIGDAGHAKFGAPAGAHDDRVISLALAWWSMTSGWVI